MSVELQTTWLTGVEMQYKRYCQEGFFWVSLKVAVYFIKMFLSHGAAKYFSVWYGFQYKCNQLQRYYNYIFAIVCHAI